ncbi:MAG TPA: hypothetical protein VH855_12460 [Acetobacteraceae bacterium]|jgi:hypothetical protein
MAIVLIRFDGGVVPVVRGAIPADPDTPISNPVRTGFKTNRPFMVEEDQYCFGLETSLPHTPLWQIVQAVEGVLAEITFRMKR